MLPVQMHRNTEMFALSRIGNINISAAENFEKQYPRPHSKSAKLFILSMKKLCWSVICQSNFWSNPTALVTPSLSTYPLFLTHGSEEEQGERCTHPLPTTAVREGSGEMAWSQNQTRFLKTGLKILYWVNLGGVKEIAVPQNCCSRQSVNVSKTLSGVSIPWGAPPAL